jgi:hypothetical protein
MKTLLLLILPLMLTSCADYYGFTERLPDLRIEYTDAKGSGFSEVFFDGKANPTFVIPPHASGGWSIEPAK